MIYLISALIGLSISAVLWARAMHKAFEFSLHYARDQAASRDVLDERGCAYSDMATVMTLALDRDGRRWVEGERVTLDELKRRHNL